MPDCADGFTATPFEPSLANDFWRSRSDRGCAFLALDKRAAVGLDRRMRIVDLTHPLSNDMAVFPGLPQPTFTPIARVEDDGYAMTEYHLLNHIGTHVDAPAHQIAGGATLDEIPLERLVTDAVTIDVSQREHGPLGLAELEPHLAGIRQGDLVFLDSNNSGNYGDDAYWTGWSSSGGKYRVSIWADKQDQRFQPAAARWHARFVLFRRETAVRPRTSRTHVPIPAAPSGTPRSRS